MPASSPWTSRVLWRFLCRALTVGLLLGGVRLSDLQQSADAAAVCNAHATGSERIVDGDALRSALRWLGRVDVGAVDGARFSWSGAGFVARFSGRALAMAITRAQPTCSSRP
jgi:hypothetical protein